MKARSVLAARVVTAVGFAGGDGTAAGSSTWERIEPGGRTSCARGGRYAYWVHRGDPRKLLIMFEGGGGCFSYATCAEGSPWFDDSVSQLDDPAAGGGLLDLERADNPFRDYSVVFIPVCTGDVHIGDNVHTYAEEGGGSRFATAGSRTPARPSPRRSGVGSATTVFVTGCSAGSAGAAFHMPAILGRYPRARVTYFGDSLAFVFGRPIDIERDWRGDRVLPPWADVDPRRFTMTRYLAELAHRYPRARSRGSTTQGMRFRSGTTSRPAGRRAASRNPAGRRGDARAHRAELPLLPRLRLDHCVTYDDRFYTRAQGGVRLRDWVARLERGRDVSCPRCPG